MKELSESQLEAIGRATLRKTGELGLRHARENLPYLGKTVLDLSRSLAGSEPRPAIVVSAGPSLHRRHSVAAIRDSGFDGIVIAVDGALGHCLHAGLVPDYVVTVDPDRFRIVRWFGDTRLSEKPEDDYYSRQDLDPALHADEVAYNERLIGLVNEYGPRIRALISSSVSPEVSQRCLESGMDMYWWNPMYDDFDEPDSYTRKVVALNKAPAITAGGNVGTASWVLAHAVLGCRDIGMVGMDFGYAPGTAARNTQYYYELAELYGLERAEDGLIEVPNPHLGETWLTDPTYYWYRQSFLALAQEAPDDVRTYNCTEGGTLFGDRVEVTPLTSFLERFGG